MNKVAKTAIAGIYCIKNTVNEDIYIGHSIDIITRWRLHKWQLEKGVHHNIYLQRAWNKYGREAFIFEIMESIPKEEIIDSEYLKDLEQIWLNSCLLNYNICTLSSSCLGIKRSDETKAKLSKALLGKTHSEERKQREGNLRVRGYLFISPNCQILEGKNLSLFCKEKNLHLSTMAAVLRGDVLSYKGWTKDFWHHLVLKRYGTFSVLNKSEGKLTKFLVKSPDGIIYTVFNQNKFCKQHNLNRSHFAAMLRGDLKQVKGWIKV